MWKTGGNHEESRNYVNLELRRRKLKNGVTEDVKIWIIHPYRLKIKGNIYVENCVENVNNSL